MTSGKFDESSIQNDFLMLFLPLPLKEIPSAILTWNTCFEWKLHLNLIYIWSNVVHYIRASWSHLSTLRLYNNFNRLWFSAKQIGYIYFSSEAYHSSEKALQRVGALLFFADFCTWESTQIIDNVAFTVSAVPLHQSRDQIKLCLKVFHCVITISQRGRLVELLHKFISPFVCCKIHFNIFAKLFLNQSCFCHYLEL